MEDGGKEDGGKEDGVKKDGVKMLFSIQRFFSVSHPPKMPVWFRVKAQVQK